MSMLSLQASILYSTIPINQQGFDWYLKYLTFRKRFTITQYFHSIPFFLPNKLKNSHNHNRKENSYLIIFRFLLVISEKRRLQNEIPHVNKRSPDLPPSIPHHPPFEYHFRHFFLPSKSTLSTLIPIQFSDKKEKESRRSGSSN